MFITTGRGKHWTHERSNNKCINRIKPIIPPNMKKDHEVNIDYGNPIFQKEYFEWNYNCVNYDLSRTFAYRNIRARKTLLLDANRQMAQIIYSRIHKKAEDLKLTLSKDPNNFKDSNDFLKQIIILRKLTCKVYCISESVLPNIISFHQFI
ncbi:hypothetical protein ACTFIW_008021 [Dictyostelium discoideum]